MLQTANIERGPPTAADIAHVPPPPARVMPQPIFDDEEEDDEPRRGPLGLVVLLVFCIAAGIGGAYAWRNYGDQLRMLYGPVKAAVEAAIATQKATAQPPPAKAPTTAAAPAAVPQAPAAPPAAAVQSPAPGGADLTTRLDRLTGEIAEIRKAIAALSAVQQQMKGDIATLRSTQSALQHAATAREPPAAHWLSDATTFATVRSIHPIVASPARPLARAARR